MEINEVIARINELAKKKKSGTPLTTVELSEKQKLYKIYLDFIRGQVTQTLDRVEFIDTDANGNETITPAKQNKLH